MRLGRRFRELPRFVKALLGVVPALAALGGLYISVAEEKSWFPFEGTPKVAIDLRSSSFNPRGYDDPAGEYVCLVNEEDHAVALTGWVLRDAERTVDVLPNFSLGAGATVRVHPGRGVDTKADLFGEEGSPAWNNSGDTVTLLDDEGTEIDSRSYGARDEPDGAGGCT